MSTSSASSASDDLRELRLHERAAIRLAGDIVAGRLAPGDQFPSAEEIVERFGFSRTVAREALQTLSMLGLIRVQHGKRTEVRQQQDWNILTPVMQEAFRRENQLEPIWRDLYEFRLLIEPGAAKLVALRGSERDLAQLVELADEMRALAGDAANARRVLLTDQAFHELIARACANRVLAGVSRSFWDAVSVLWLESHLSREELAAVAQQHQQIAEAIARRDGEAAARAMEAHLRTASTMDVGHLARDAARS